MNQTVEQAMAALAGAKAAYLTELELDVGRSKGCAAQERRREQHQHALREAITQGKRHLENARRAALAVQTQEGWQSISWVEARVLPDAFCNDTPISGP